MTNVNEVLYDTEIIKFGKEGKKSLIVRGLCTQDLTIAAKKHKGTMKELFDLLEGGLSAGREAEFGWELMDKFPDLAVQMIALAADMPDRAGELSKLPAPVQLKVLEAIYRLTIEDTGGMDDFLERVFSILALVKQRKTP